MFNISNNNSIISSLFNSNNLASANNSPVSRNTSSELARPVHDLFSGQATNSRQYSNLDSTYAAGALNRLLHRLFPNEAVVSKENTPIKPEIAKNYEVLIEASQPDFPPREIANKPIVEAFFDSLFA